MDKFNVLKFLQDNVEPAAGCTEAVAIGLSTAIAYNALFVNLPKTVGNAKKIVPYPDVQKLEKIELIIDKNIFKNANSVAIPNTRGKKGIKMAAALGIFLDENKFFKDKKHPGYLKIFNQLNDKILQDAEKLTDEVVFEVGEFGDDPDATKGCETEVELYISSILHYDNQSAKVILHKHDEPYFIKVNGRILYKKNLEKRAIKKNEEIEVPIESIINIIERITEEDKEEIQKTIDTNKLLVEEGLLQPYGMGITGILKDLINRGLLSDDLTMKIKLQVAAAVEARMGGAPKSAMSTSGSGNMGITATVPLIVVGENLKVDKDRILKAILLSHLIVKVASDYIGKLSSLCGNYNKSAFGATAGLTYLLGGGYKEIKNAINSVASNIVGVVCDGAKYGCALKAMTAATVAWESALFCVNGLQVPSDGIVESSADETLKNFKEISKAMKKVDDTIVDIILKRRKGEEAALTYTRQYNKEKYGNKK